VSRGINDGEVIFGSFELPKGDIDGDTSFSLRLKFVHNPSVFERSFSSISRLLLELFNSSLINTTAFVDEMTSGG
jgi:hypothetical protein